MDNIWRAGDKVKLIGPNWNQSYDGMGPGSIVTLKSCEFSSDETGQEWSILEEEYYVQSDPSAAWAAVKVEDGPHAPTPTGEVRTTSATGGEKGVKPEAYALIPWEAMDEVARVYNAGAQKYAAHNWRKGYEWSKSFSAACRHLFAFWRGEDRDPELGTLHLANAVFHLLGMITFALNREKYGDFDDRYNEAAPDSDS